MLPVSNLLAAKVGGHAGDGLKTDLIKEAESAVNKLTEDYRDWAVGGLKTLEGILGEIASAPAKTADLLPQAFDIPHNMKGNGATFGYDLVTVIADSGCAILRDRTLISPENRVALSHHVAALRIVLDKRITGTGGEPGRRLIARLGSMTAHSSGA